MASRVLGFHLVLTTYGFWLPNDPRGSYSDHVWAVNLKRFGRATKVDTHRSVAKNAHNKSLRLGAKLALVRDPVRLTGLQAWAVARGFRAYIEKSGLIVWACCILPDHAHRVVARHRYSIEKVARLLKGGASASLRQEGCHPFQHEKYADGTIPSPWARQE